MKVLIQILLLFFVSSIFAQTESFTREWGTYFNNVEITSVDTDNEENIWVLAEVRQYQSFFLNDIITPNAQQTNYGGGIKDVFLAKFTPDGSLLYATYFGGEGDDFAGSISIKNGNIYITGNTNSTQGIATTGVYQENLNQPPSNYTNPLNSAFIAKYDTSGQLEWSSYFQGNTSATIRQVSAGNANDVFLWGTTQSDNLGSPGVFKNSIPPPYVDDNDIYVYPSYPILARFNDTGHLLWATYYGPDIVAQDNPRGYSVLSGLGVDYNNNVYISGNCNGTSNFYSTPNSHQSNYAGGERDIFIAKFTPSGQRIWGSYFGGAGSEGLDKLEVLRGNQIYLTGITTSQNGISTPNTWQPNYLPGQNNSAFIARFTQNGQIMWSTYLGPIAGHPVSLGADTSNNVYIYGEILANPNIITTGSYMDEFFGNSSQMAISKLDYNGQNLLWGTYYGGSQNEYTSWTKAFTVTNNNALVAVGLTKSHDFIASDNAFQATFNNSSQVNSFITKFVPCVDPVVPQGESVQWFTEGETLEDLIIDTTTWPGADVIITWYADAANTQVLPADTVLEENTTYYVTQTIQGCGESDALEITAIQNLNVDKAYFEKVIVSPNPNQGKFNIDNIPPGKTEIEIHSLNGKLLFSTTTYIQDLSNTIKIREQLAPGVYFLKLISADKYSKAFKLLIN